MQVGKKRINKKPSVKTEGFSYGVKRRENIAIYEKV